jgi:hypothetical protein
MLKKTSAHRLLFTRDSLWSLLEAVRDELAGSGYEISLEELPAFEKVFPKLAHETAADPFEPVAMPARGVFVNDTLVILHSSGSTVSLPSFSIAPEFVGILTLLRRAFRSRSRGPSSSYRHLPGPTL